MKIIADENIPFVKQVCEHLGEVTLLPGREMNADNVKNADILLVRSVTKVSETLLKGSQVKFAATATIGEDHIDKEYLKTNNIGFSSAPGSNAESVAEYVFTALTVLSKKYDFDLRSKTLGIVGLGNVGSRVKKRADILGMKTFLNDPPKQRETGSDIYTDLKTLLNNSDIVTVHVPLNRKSTDPTYHLISEDFMKELKEGAILINSSRGKVMSENAIKNHKEKLGGLILDVWEDEPCPDHDTLNLADIVTPHIAGYSYDGKVCGTEMIYKAACAHFHIKEQWSVDISDNSLIIDLTDSKESFYDAITQAYPITEDDANLRQILKEPADNQARFFDQLRKNYPKRREFKNWTLKVKKRSENIELLEKLGFTIDLI